MLAERYSNCFQGERETPHTKFTIWNRKILEKGNAQWNGHMIQKHWDLEWAETMTAYQIMNELFKIKKKKKKSAMDVLS